MATGGLYGQSSAGIVSPQSGSESSGLYGNNTVFGGTYFEWFIFQVSDTQPVTPTGGSWNFTTNIGIPPAGWLGYPPSSPTNTVWVSVGVVSSKNNTAITWSTPGKFSFSSGLPILSGVNAPLPGDGQSDQLYVETGTNPDTLWFKQAGTWTRLTGSNLYVDVTNNQTVGGQKTFSSQIIGSISGSAANVTGVVAIANGGTGASTAANARTNLGLGSAAVLTAGAANGVATLDAGGTVPLSQIPASIQGGVSYQGTWNATTNSPTLTSSVGTKGYYYVVSTAGSTNLNGITSWNIGDWAIFNGTAWEKIDNTDAVTSVNGYTGTVVLTQTDISGTASLTTTQTLTNKTLTSPIINEILDANGNEILGLSPTASATDFLTIKNGIGVGVPLHVYADGSSASIGLHIQPKGSGLVTISDGTDFNKGIRFRSSGSAASAITLLDAVSTAGRVVTLPDATTTLVGRDTTDTLTNKTLTSPTLTTPVLGTPTSGNFSTGTFTWPTFNQNTTGNAATATTATNVSGGTASVTTLTTSSTVTHNGGTANGVGYLNGSKVLTTGSALVFDGTNLGLGVTPSAWATGYTALELSKGVAYWAYSGAGAPSSWSTANAILDSGGFKYKVSAQATGYNQAAGAHTWYNAPSGTAGNAITFTQAMTLDASGNLLVGTTTVIAGIKLNVNGGINSTNGALNVSGNGGFYNSSNKFGVDNNAGASRLYSSGPNSSTRGSFEFHITDSVGSLDTTAMTLNASGNLGIGVTDPATYGGALVTRVVSGANLSIRTLSGLGGSGTGVGLDSLGNGAGGVVDMGIRANTIQFRNAGSEVARIDSSGNLLVGTTTFAGKGWSILPTGGAITDYSGTATFTHLEFKNNNGSVGSIQTNGSITLYNTTSDYRLKTVIGPIADAGSRIDALEPIEYEWKADGSRTRGFLAHKFQEVYAGSVSGAKDAVDAEDKPVYQSMQASSAEVIADLVAEIQSLRQRLAAAGI